MSDESSDPLDEFRKPDGSLPHYIERAYSLYEAATFFMAALKDTGNPHTAARMTCEAHGHDAPDGKCLRCGLGSGAKEKRKDPDQEMRERIRKREEWLHSRGGRAQSRG